MQDKYAMKVSNGVVEFAQQGIDWKKLLVEAQEVIVVNRQIVNQEITIQRFVEKVKAKGN